MTNLAGRTSLSKYFDFPPGSRVGVTKNNIIIPQYSADRGMIFIKFEKGDICEIMEDRIINCTDDYEYSSVYATTQPRVVHKSGHNMLGSKLVPRSTRRAKRRTGSSYQSLVKQIHPWPFPRGEDPQGERPTEYKYMQGLVPTQAVLMDEFEKEAADDARYNAVPSRFVPSKIEHF